MTLNERLENWGRWARDRQRFSHCASIEHRYRSPQHWNPPQPTVFVDVLDAGFIHDLISEAVQSNRMTASQSKALKYQYIEPGYNRWKAAAKCGVYTPKRLELLIHESKVLVMDLLELRTGIRYPTSNNSSNGRSLAQPDIPPEGGLCICKTRPASRR